jgi:hypothetical protein
MVDKHTANNLRLRPRSPLPGLTSSSTIKLYQMLLWLLFSASFWFSSLFSFWSAGSCVSAVINESRQESFIIQLLKTCIGIGGL